MLITALLVPATTWWASLRYYQAHKQAEDAMSSTQRWEQMYAAQRERMLKDVKEENTIEGVPEVRSVWTAPDPDNIWHGQLQQADKTLMQHHLPALNASYNLPPTRRLPGR